MQLWFWNLTGRLQWFINGVRQVETRRQTRKRAKEFAELIRNDDVDIASVVMFLLSDQSDYMTGTNVFVDGGYHIQK